MAEFYSNSRILSYNRDFMFVMGNRSAGKSFAWKCYCIDRFLKKGEQFIYMRRYDNELDNIKTLFDDIKDIKYPNVDFYIKGKEIYINGELAGWAVPLSIAYKFKSSSYVNVGTIMFDEFLSETKRYLKDEVDMAMNFYQTVARGGGKAIRKVKFIFIANAVSVFNPYFSNLNIIPKEGYTKSKSYVVELFTNESVNKEIAESQFYDLIKDTKYGQYAMLNSFYLDSNSFVGKESLTNASRYVATLKYEETEIAVYEMQDYLYCCSKVNKQFPSRYAFTTRDHDLNYIMLYRNKRTPVLDYLRVAFQNAQMRFETMQIKARMFQIMNVIE